MPLRSITARKNSSISSRNPRQKPIPTDPASISFQFKYINPSGRHKKQRQKPIEPERWADVDDVILDLLSKKFSYKDIRAELKANHNFTVNERQFNNHLTKLNYRRNAKRKPAIDSESNGQAASDHFSPALAIAADGPLDFDIDMPEPAIVPNATQMSNSPELQRNTVTERNLPVQSNVFTTDDPSDSDIVISETTNESNATQIVNYLKSHGSRCGVVDLSQTLNTPIRRLLDIRPNDHDGLALRFLAKRLINIATDEGIAILDRTLSEVIQEVEEVFASERFCLNEGQDDHIEWFMNIRRITVGDYAVVIHIYVRCAERGHVGDGPLALRLRIASFPKCVVEGSLTLIVCPGFECSATVYDAIDDGDIDEVECLLDSGKVTVACVIANPRFNGIGDSEVDYDITMLFISHILAENNASSNLINDSWQVATGRMIVHEIWDRLLVRWRDGGGGSEESFQADFLRCKELTSLARRKGVRIDECVDGFGACLMDRCKLSVELRKDERLQLLRYFQGIGVNMEHRNNYGQTPLLSAISMVPQNLGIISDFLDMNANLHAEDDMGRGYLHAAFKRLGFLRSEGMVAGSDPAWFDHAWFDYIYQFELLVTLLSADERFTERAITPSETPRLIELAFSAVAWDVWTRVFEKLNWDMKEMNAYRYMTLRKPLPTYLDHYEEARLQMLGQTRFQLGRHTVDEFEAFSHEWESIGIIRWMRDCSVDE